MSQKHTPEKYNNYIQKHQKRVNVIKSFTRARKLYHLYCDLTYINASATISAFIF